MVLEDRPLVKLQGIDVLETGKEIQSWLNQTDPTVTRFSEFTQRIFDVISRVSGIEENNFPAINFVGIARAMIKFNSEVLYYLITI